MRQKSDAMTVCYLIFLGLASLCTPFQVSDAASEQEKTTATQTVTAKPRLIVLPLVPHEDLPYDGTGLAVQFLLGNVVALHPSLKELWFGWRIDKIFPQKVDFKNYCRGDGPQLNLVKLGKEQEIRYWLLGRVQPQNSNMKVFLTLVDAGRKGFAHNTALTLDPSDQLIGLRKEFLAWLETCGLSMSHTQAAKALWPERTTLRALSLLGRALESQYLNAIGKHEAPLDLQLFDQAVSAAPASYMALDLKAWVLFKNRDYGAAEDVFRSALEANPDGVGALSGLMWCAIRTENEAEAYFWAGTKAEILGESLAVGKASAASRLGNAAYKAKAYGKAIALYHKATTWNPAKRIYVTKLAGAYRKNAQFRQALEVIDSSLERFPTAEDRRALLIDKAESLSSLAKSLRTARRYREALHRFEEALAIDRIYRPQAAVDGLENLASIHDALGDHARALESRQRALEMMREHSESQQ